MLERRPKKVVKKSDLASQLRNALAKRTKDELVDIFAELAGKDRGILRRLPQAPVLGAQPSPVSHHV